MIQVLDDGSHGSLLASHKARAHGTCQCYRFDQSWNCPEHPEVPWDHEWRQFVPPTDPRHPQVAGDQSVLSVLNAMYGRLIQAAPAVNLQFRATDLVRPAMDRLLLLEDFSMARFANIPAPGDITVREHHDSEDRVVLRYIQEDDRGDR
jgi:hypothetical protein